MATRRSARLMTGTMLLAFTLIPGTRATAQWKPEHTALAIASSTAITTDWLMSVNAARRGNFDEMNPILGAHPSVGQLNTYNMLILGSNVAIAGLLPSRFRTLWFTAVTSFEAAIVLHQYNIGLHINLGQM